MIFFSLYVQKLDVVNSLYTDVSRKMASCIWVKVLKTYCNDEIIKEYENVKDEKIKETFISALKGKVIADYFQNYSPVMQRTSEKSDPEASPSLAIEYHKDDDELLMQALISENPLISPANDLTEVKRLLRIWGLKLPKFLQLATHEATIQATEKKLQHEYQLRTLHSDSSTLKNVGYVSIDFSKLSKIHIKDLMLFQTASGKYIEGRIISRPCVMTGVTIHIEDRRFYTTRLV